MANDRQNISICSPSNQYLKICLNSDLYTPSLWRRLCVEARSHVTIFTSHWRQKCFHHRLLLRSGSVAKLTELDNKIISTQDQLYYFLDWTILLTPCIVSLNRHGFSSSIVTSLPVHISQKLREKLELVRLQGSQKGRDHLLKIHTINSYFDNVQ